MKIQKMKLTELKPLENNVRKHSEVQIRELVRSVKQFGQTRAIVIDEKNNILIGNGLHEAMVNAGLEEAFVYRKRGLSEIEKKKLILADNKTYALGSDDFENVEAYLEEITATGDFEIAGFEEDALRSLMRQAEEVLADVQSYGVLSEDVVAQKQRVADKRSASLDDEAPHATESHRMPENAPISDSSATDDNSYVHDGAEAVKTVFCPNCGECIPID
jgi:ParB-like chromosome segregation protein Spo0J